MAADRPLAERRIVEIKMGRSKFPGKPSKIGNRKRVNLSSCALPDDNDSSKAAKKIYLGLSVFNETFGDNEMVAPGPFHGFSMVEVEEAMAEARLQQKEAEVEHKKQGININLWDNFQNELFSITSCSSYNTNIGTIKNHEVSKPKLSFDGGGFSTNKKIISNSLEVCDNLPSVGLKSEVTKGHKLVKVSKTKNVLSTPDKKTNMAVKFTSPRLKLGKLQYSPNLSKSLQSQAAKKLLEKAKLSNYAENNKNSSTDRKFILPSHSIHSSRVIKPNKRFLEENENKRKFLRSLTTKCASESLNFKKQKVSYLAEGKLSNHKKLGDDMKLSTGSEVVKKKAYKKESNSETKLDDKVLTESSKNSIQSSGKVILREARLQLNKSNLSLLEGPFSSPSACSLSSNSHLKVNPVQSVSAPGSIVCGVCGVVRFYRFVELAKKFGIYCCESCRKFITKIIKSYDKERNFKIECINNKGLCGVLSIVKNQDFSVGKCANNFKCHACWLKLCLKNFKMPSKLKNRLLKLLPINMQMSINLEISPVMSNDTTNKFAMCNNNLKDFKWLHQKCNSSSEIKVTNRDSFSDKQQCGPNLSDCNVKADKFLRKRKDLGSENKLKPVGQKMKVEGDEKSRQLILLKGPRVKHVCRSASVALGQPLATFSNEMSPTKKQTNETSDNCKNCDNLLTTNSCIEPQEVSEKSSKEVAFNETKQINGEKKSNISKQTTNSKVCAIGQQSGMNKSKKKVATKAENPVSMDFWESYDPEEISETGFGLIGSEPFTVRALCFICGSSGQEKMIHCASCCEPYHEFCVDEGQLKLQDASWKYDWVCPRCTVCATCGRTSGQQLKCIKCDNSYHTECVDRVGGRLLHSPDRPWVCSICLRCKSCNGVDVSVFVGNLPLCKACFILRQKGNYCPLCQRCYEDDDYDSKMMECGRCKCWVHAKCEGLSDEKYQVLSFLPESVEYICRMCCVMPPAPWWIAVEAELKSGYLGVLKALSKNRKACTMLKWSPRKQCTCRQVSFVSRALDFEEMKPLKSLSDTVKNTNETFTQSKDCKVTEQNSLNDKTKNEKCGPVTERKTSVEVINHPTGSLKLRLKITKGTDLDERERIDKSDRVEEAVLMKNVTNSCNTKESTVRVKKCPSNEENSEDSLTNAFDCQEDSQTSLHSIFKMSDFSAPLSELPGKRSLSSPLNPPSDSGIGSTDDELKASCLTDEETCKPDDHQSNLNRGVEIKSNCDTSVSFLEEKHECFCFLEVDSYNSRSKPFSPNLMSIKKKVTTSEYSSLHQFHQDMQRMIATTQSVELMELYHQTIKEIFPWFDPKFSRVQSSTQKISGMMSVESTPVKNTPTKNSLADECKVPKDKLSGQCLDYFYSDYVVEDNRMCLMCKTIGDGPPGDTGRLLYCGQNEWVHCNCALWSGEVFEEIDGSLQNVHSAISRGRSIRCPECNLKGASIGCCARNCQETYHFRCARKVGCTFMDDKTVYCPAHMKESVEKLVQSEKEFEIRRPVYVELDKRKMKVVDSSQIRFAVGALQVNSLGKFVMKLSDHSEAIIPQNFGCTRLFWSCYEPWRIVRYHFSVRLIEVEDDEGVDIGVNLTIDHSKEPELLELKLKQLKYFQDHNTFLDINEKLIEESIKIKRKLCEPKVLDESYRNRSDDVIKVLPVKRPKKDFKSIKKTFDQFDSKEDDNCLSDNQNTADLLPPDLEEAIFKDLPHDILDGISMQDIFMDIKNDPYENNAKEGISEDSSEIEEISGVLSNKLRRNECNQEEASQNDFWVDSGESRHEIKSKKNEFDSETTSQNEYWLDDCRQDITDDVFSSLKQSREQKKTKSDGLSVHHSKKLTTLKAHQKSCNLIWSTKTEGSLNKWKKSSKCHVTVNLFEPQERGNMLQELKFTDGLVTISTGTLDPVKDFKTRLEENKRSLQREEGKENKCLQWHTRLQPRILQVDGNVDSSSSGSEAGESPQRLIEETVNSKIVPPPQSSPFLHSPIYSINSPVYPATSSYTQSSTNFSLDSSSYPVVSNDNYAPSEELMRLPQVDGASDFYSGSSDSEDSCFETSNFHKKSKRDKFKNINVTTRVTSFKINQCDGGIDSESDDGDPSKCTLSDVSAFPLLSTETKDEPVKCNKCHCTYRTKISYQRHLQNCNTNFMLSSSEGEMSEDESPKKINGTTLLPKTEVTSRTDSEKTKNSITKEVNNVVSSLSTKQVSPNDSVITERSLETTEKLEVKKEKVNKRTYTRKKSVQNVKKPPVTCNTQQVQQILVQQPNNAPPALIVQDISAPNIVPATFIDSSSTIGYVTAVDSQNPFGKPQLIATPNGLISGNFPFSAQPETQILGGLCLNPQGIQTNVPSIIIQQPQPQGTLISSQAGPVMMSGEQMVLGPTGLFELIQDPRTGGMFLASHNQPLFYNMETMVSNTVMQTNQFVSNVLATSFSQTSTQVFQTSKLEQVVNLPPNYIVVGPNSTSTDKIISTNDLICVQTPQTLISNHSPIQIPSQPIFNPSLQAPQTISAEPKIISSPINPTRCIQPLQVKQICPSIVLNKIVNPNPHVINQTVTPVFRAQEPNIGPNYQSTQIKAKTAPNKSPGSNQFRSFPMMRPNVAKSPSKTYEKAVITPKTKPQVQPRSRALVDYINNFRSESCDTFPTSLSKEPCIPEHKAPSSPIKSKLLASPVSSSKCTVNVVPSNMTVPPFESPKISPLKSEAEVMITPEFTATPTDFSVQAPAENGQLCSATSLNTTDNSKFSDNAVTNKLTDSPIIKGMDLESEFKCLPEDSKKDSSDSQIANKAPKVLTNMTNSLCFDQEVKLNMPNLGDSLSPNSVFQQQTSTEVSPKSANQADEILPLQENSQSINTNAKNFSKSPEKVSPLSNKNLTPPSDEKLKFKKKISSSDQNSIDTVSNTSQQKQEETFPSKIYSRNILFKKNCEEKGPKLIFDVTSDDGFKSSSTSMVELWANICDSVQEMRSVLKIPPLPLSRKGHEILGMQNHGLQHCLEQLKGVEQCVKYKCKYFMKEESQKDEDDVSLAKENLSGCARTEKFTTRKEYDMFAWLASKHRQLPKLTESAEETISSIRRANSLPMAMRYRNLKENAKLYVGVYRSKIHGRGLFCLREIEAGEMVIEYAGEVIRSNLTDKREKYYTDKGIGCYMFRIDDHFVVDATMKGNAARFINHSCEPNCYSRVVDILGKKHIVIFALRRINIMEELTYDYKFPFEDEKISCHCLSKKCRKYLN